VHLQDLDIHGFTSRAMIGPIGGEIDLNRVRMAYNGNAGWDFDDGNATQSVNGNVKASYLTIEWNGCNEEYPVTHQYSAISCYDDSSGGYGDGLGTPPTPLDFSCDHCTADYNTQDGMDLGHTQQSTISFTNSLMYGNMGGTYKIGPNYRMTLTNDLSLGNCKRMSAAIGDVPSTFNANLSDFCRAGDHMGANFYAGASAADSVLDYEFNTFVGYESTTIDVQCGGTAAPTCSPPSATTSSSGTRTRPTVTGRIRGCSTTCIPRPRITTCSSISGPSSAPPATSVKSAWTRC
jgi:hypothetical protein